MTIDSGIYRIAAEAEAAGKKLGIGRVEAALRAGPKEAWQSAHRLRRPLKGQPLFFATGSQSADVDRPALRGERRRVV
jgi:hypothetical protein